MSRKERRRLKTLQQEQGASNAPSAFDAEMIPNQAPPPEQARPAAVSRRLRMEFQSFEGPIPPPEILGLYEQVCPGSSDRILTQFEEQGRHRRALEKRALNYNILSATIGQVTGFLLFLAAIAAGVFLLYHDKPVGGIATIISAVGGAAWVLHKAESAKKKDLAEKRPEAKKR